jgi:amino acid transporter
VAAIISAAPSLQPYQAHLSALLVLVIALVNLRGVRESGVVFALPTYSFLVGVLGLMAYGVFRWVTGTFPPSPPVHPAAATAAVAPLTMFLLLRAFSGGCTAMTGVEAVSNGIPAFRPPESDNAAKTLRYLAYLLGAMVIGTAVLASVLHIVPIPEAAHGYRTVLSMIAERLVGRSFFFYFVQLATMAILMMAANTSFADFPRMCSFLARDGYLPRQLGAIGDRLVFHWGILLLACVSIALIYAFGGYTNRLLPLYAIGVFVSFSLSQFGMVVRWTRLGGGQWRRGLNLIGAILTSIVGLTFAITKFREGAWMVPVVGAFLLLIFWGVKRHYDYYASRLRPATYTIPPIRVGTVLILVPRIHRGILPAVNYAKTIAKDCRALHVSIDPGKVAGVKEEWERFGSGIPLVILESPYRSLLDPIKEYLDETLAENPESWVTVVVPEAVPSRWWHVFLHKNVAFSIKRLLAQRRRVVVTNVRYHL